MTNAQPTVRMNVPDVSLVSGSGSVCMYMQATPGPAGHPRGVLCPSGWGLVLLRVVVKLRSDRSIRRVTDTIMMIFVVVSTLLPRTVSFVSGTPTFRASILIAGGEAASFKNCMITLSPRATAKHSRLRLCVVEPPEDAVTLADDDNATIVPAPAGTQTPAAAFEQPVGIHPGVLCDVTLNPIVGFRYTDGEGYDLCQAAFDELTPAQQRRLQRLEPPITPRRTLLAGAALALFMPPLLASLQSSAPSSKVDEDEPTGWRGSSGREDDLWELPELSPAEKLVAAFFRPSVPAGQREVDPTATRARLMR